MPYESFATEKQVTITEVVLDTATNAWMYHIHVHRGNYSNNNNHEDDDGFSHEYIISRRFSEFKQLHAGLVPIMGDKLTALPADGLMTLIMADNEALLAERKQVLERILTDVLNHPVAKELPEVLQFIGYESSSAKVLAPLYNTSGPCTGSIRKTSSPSWTTMVTS